VVDFVADGPGRISAPRDQEKQPGNHEYRQTDPSHEFESGQALEWRIRNYRKTDRAPRPSSMNKQHECMILRDYGRQAKLLNSPVWERSKPGLDIFNG